MSVLTTQKIDISDQVTVLNNLTIAFNAFKAFVIKMNVAWNKLNVEEKKKMLASGKFPLYTYAKTMKTELDKLFPDTEM